MIDFRNEEKVSNHPDAGTVQWRKSKIHPGQGKFEFIGYVPGHAQKIRAMWSSMSLCSKDKGTVDTSLARKILAIGKAR